MLLVLWVCSTDLWFCGLYNPADSVGRVLVVLLFGVCRLIGFLGLFGGVGAVVLACRFVFCVGLVAAVGSALGEFCCFCCLLFGLVCLFLGVCFEILVTLAFLFGGV